MTVAHLEGCLQTEDVACANSVDMTRLSGPLNHLQLRQLRWLIQRPVTLHPQRVDSDPKHLQLALNSNPTARTYLPTSILTRTATYNHPPHLHNQALK